MPAVVRRLLQATNDHDLEGLVACFADDYRNETPAHPARGFVGRAQVRRNWSRIFSTTPDVSAAILRSSVDGDCCWSEWTIHGTRPDGDAFDLRGVILFGVEADSIHWARFYLEPLDGSPAGADVAVQRHLGDTP